MSTGGATQKADRATHAYLGLEHPLGLSFDAGEKLRYQKDGAFCKPERCRHHDLRFQRLIDPALHAEEGDFEGFFTAIIVNTVCTNHVLILHHHV
jgi:hypothetical protein